MSKRTRIITGIDMGSSLIKVMVFRASEKDGEQVSHVIGFGKAESRGIERGYVVNHADALRALQNALAEAEKNAKHHITDAYLSIGGEMLGSNYAHGETIAQGPNQIIAHDDIERAIAYGTEQIRGELVNMHLFPEIVLRTALDDKKVIGHAEGMQGNKLEVDTIIVSALQQQYDALKMLAQHAGVRIVDAVPSPLASSIVSLSRVHKRMGAMLVDIGAETTTVTVFEESRPVALVVLTIGSANLTEELAVHFRITPEEADKIKRVGVQGTAFPKKKYDTVVQDFYTKLFTKIRDHFRRMKFRNILPAGVFLTGGGALASGIDEIARTILELPARNVATPFEKKGGIPHEYLMTVYGTCMWAVNLDDEAQETGIPTPTKTKGFFSYWLKQFIP
ncbi:hypothetical protein A3C87_01300 [Candidatus Kaiserbacteria bacterium RIFCSPHIGHO2_02_FULL_49_34]|uniref:SHS2 domain-containing protein n=1 Tax=Candidatus Kaiserbacteria bacterium RIFCSPHIGHO2_02_FULL_49_34 TaxID=1798491 RepID=A0A1F6DLA7_9BACT|nr:MAG: hypothetical protein A3C87_01300 [Candidatus Kaiserbacteria bacterium RIFCSPHIGHO2_02_FULL_49_34]